MSQGIRIRCYYRYISDQFEIFGKSVCILYYCSKPFQHLNRSG